MPRKTTLHVQATNKDRPCPMVRTAAAFNRKTGRDSSMIYHDEVREVPNVRFYRRRILKGDLKEVTPIPKQRKAKEMSR